MYMLAVDTSSMNGSLCLFRCDQNAELVAEKSWGREHQHSDFITQALNELLSEAKISLNELELLAVTNGPGSFTGIRVGINLVRSLGYSLGVPVVVADAFQVMKQGQSQAPSSALQLFAVYAFRNLLYVAGYKNDQQIVSPQAIALTEMDQLLQNESEAHFCGTGWALVESDYGQSFKNHQETHPQARHLGVFAWTQYREKRQVFKWIEVTPLYIRNSEAEEKLKSGLLKPVNERNIKDGDVPNS